MKCLLPLLLLLFSVNLIAQCSITKEIGKHSTTYIAKMETVYLNEDLENGISKYELRVVLNKDTDYKKPLYYMLQCRYMNSGQYRLKGDCVPRSIVFQSLNGQSMSISALKEEDVPTNSPGVQCRLYTYEISSELEYFLKTSSLKSITFWDKRTSQGVPTVPYKDLLKEQFECIWAYGNGKL